MESLWVIAFFMIIVVSLTVLVVILIIVPTQPELQPILPPSPTGKLLSVCQGNQDCSSGLICVPIANETQNRCLLADGQTCLNNSECASGTCQKNGGSVGTCQSGGMPAPPPSQQQLFCYNNNTWVSPPDIQVPTGITIRKISAFGNRLIGVAPATNLVYLLTPGSGWQNITGTISPPGQIVDAAGANNNQIWLVYRLTNGSTPLYQLVNGSLVPVNSGGTQSGGLQVTQNGQVITIHQLEVHPNGDIFVAGTIPGGDPMLFQRTSSSNTYQALVMTRLFTLIPSLPPSNFAFVEGTSIIIMGSFSNRINNIQGTVTGLAVTPQGVVWYIAGNTLYRNQAVISPPLNLTSQTSLFYSSMYGLCLG